MARLRELLGPNKLPRISAFINLRREWLPPIGTVDASLKLETGAQGSFQWCVSTTLEGRRMDHQLRKGERDCRSILLDAVNSDYCCE